MRYICRFCCFLSVQFSVGSLDCVFGNEQTNPNKATTAKHSPTKKKYREREITIFWSESYDFQLPVGSNCDEITSPPPPHPPSSVLS